MMEEMKNGVFTYNGVSHNFDFMTSLSAHDKQTFVKTVVNNLVGDDGYDVVIRDLIFDFIVVDIFTNIDTSFINMKDDDGNDINPVILIEHFLEETNVADIVKANMEAGLLDELNRAVDLNIRYLTGIHPSPIADSIASLLSTIEKKINEVDLDSMMDMAKTFAGMTGDITPESIINAYITSDIHKKNLSEIEEFKKKQQE